MNTILGDALSKALDDKKNDYSKFVWKGPKVKDENNKISQEIVKLVDASPAQLIKFYQHCNKMLFNDDPKNPGRYNVFEQVKNEMNNCNIELLVRYFENNYLAGTRPAIKRHAIAPMLFSLKHNNGEIEDWDSVKMKQISALESYVPEGIPDEFANISINELMAGCTNSLGAFDKSHLTMTFIVKMGLWIVKSEENELNGKTNSNIERLKIAKERLHIPEKLNLRFSDKGLSFHEMRAILTLPRKQRYSDMTTEQLITLRNKVLVRYLKEVDNHIYSWKQLKNQIELVAKSKNIKLV